MGQGSALSPSLLSWLRCFDAAARCSSFTKAASELHVSQGAISQQVKKLEDWLGHPLLLRAQTGLTLTADGERLFTATQISFAGLESAVHAVKKGLVKEPVNVSCAPSFAMLWLTLRLESFYRAHPHISLRIVGQADPIDASRMARDGLAAAVRFESGSGVNTGTKLFDEWLIPVATPAFMQAHPELAAIEDVNGSLLLHGSDPGDSNSPSEEWSRWLMGAGIVLPAERLRQGTQFNLSQLAVQAALGGQGIAVVRAALVVGYLTQGRLVAPFRKRVRLEGFYSFIGNPLHPEMQTVLAWISEEANKYTRHRDALFDSADILAV